jgi:hypothetical protein
MQNQKRQILHFFGQFLSHSSDQKGPNRNFFQNSNTLNLPRKHVFDIKFYNVML